MPESRTNFSSVADLLIDLDPGRPMLPTSLDAGPTRFRKMVEVLVAEGGR